MRKGGEALARTGDPPEREPARGPVPGGVPPDRLMRPDHVGELPANGERRIERGQRVLEDHRYVAAAHQ